MRQRLLVLGTHTFAEEVADVARHSGFEVAGFVENLDRDRTGGLNGLPVLWIDEAAELAADHLAVCALSTTRRSRFVDEAGELGFRFASVVHPSARLSATSSAGEGSILSVGTIVAAQAALGRHVILNRGAMVGHHTEVGDYASIQPGANIAGACTIGEGAYIGIGAVVLDHLSVGRDAVVGAGAVVTRDVPDRVQVMGVPARITKEGIDGM